MGKQILKLRSLILQVSQGVFDILGQLVQLLVDGSLSIGGFLVKRKSLQFRARYLQSHRHDTHLELLL